MNNLQIVLALTLLATAYSSPQRRPAQRTQLPQQQQLPQQEQNQFSARFDPNDSRNQDFYAPQPQQQQQQQQQPQRPQPVQQASQSRAGPSYQETTTYIPIIRFDKQQTADGGYKTLWETGNNIVAEETGVLKSFGNNKDNPEAVVQHGSYSYTSPEGQLINVQYTADENGFRASGDHLPTPPPVPADIQKALDVIYAGIAQQRQNGGQNYQEDDGQYKPEDSPQQQQQQQQQQRQGNINFRPTGNNRFRQ